MFAFQNVQYQFDTLSLRLRLTLDREVNHFNYPGNGRFGLN